jgi:RNA polymerase sigma-70 factor (ECF subfamily)
MDEKIREEKPTSEVTEMESLAVEQGLIEAAQAGDSRAFGQLLRRHQKRLFRFVLGITGSFDQTEDVVQDAFIRAYSALDSFEAGRRFYPWLSTIARNLAFNQRTREKKKDSFDKIQEQGFDPPSPELGPLEKLISSDGQKRFYAALAELPEKYRDVFVLRHFEDMSYDDIAAKLKIPSGTVDSRLYRARTKLMEKLKDLL